jgi:hypothetical protein
MAQVRLWIDPRDTVISDLPRVCMKCGADATTVRKKQFSWYPPWVIVLIFLGVWPFLIVALILTKRRSVEVPFCDQHKNHWLIRILAGGGAVAALVAAGVLAFVAIESLAPKGKGDDLSGFLCLGWFVLLLVLAIGLAIYNNLTTIRTTEITEREITLTNVSPDFARAVAEEEAALEGDIDGEVRDRWKENRKRGPRRDDDRYERGDRPPRKRSTDISEEEDE